MKPPVAVWAVATVASRLPVAMAPLAFVFFAKGTPGGYGLGAVLAAAYTLAEAAGAPVLGTRLGTRPMHRELSIGIAVSAVALGGFTLSTSAPAAVTVVLAVIAGAAGAAAPGGLRTMAARLVDEADVPAMLSFEAVLNQSVWALAPAVTGVLALGVAPSVPFAVAAGSAALAAVLVPMLPKQSATARPEQPQGSPARMLWSVWPIYLTSAAAMYLLATVELALPALLEHRGVAVGWAGPLLTGFAVASIAGGIVYGLRAWPGSHRTRSLVLLVLIAALVGMVGLSPWPAGIAAGLLLSGLLQAALLVSRNLSLRDRLPEHTHAAGYSLMYAASGIGYGASGVAIGAVLAADTPVLGVLAGAGVTVVLALVSAFAEARTARLGPAPAQEHP
ncbi:MFS transporter [Amycolatopsis samaneae]|uniref:MFS transporter n=2 Tax=Amycolatopsis samaneae TaxID=664691 RepID=A0ABW5GT78_9PSEU